MSQDFNPQIPPVKSTDRQAQPEMLYLPETMQSWPWPRAVNCYHEQVSRESNAWIVSFRPLDERSQRAWNLCDFGLLSALVYPRASKEHLRTGTDLMSVLFLVDEYTDVKPQPIVEDIVKIAISAINNPGTPRPEGEIILGEIVRQFWVRAERNATPEAAKHFVESFTDYLQSVIVQAGARDDAKIHTVGEYFKTRRENVGVRVAFFPGELHISIPDYAFYHPIITELKYLIVDIVTLDNDMASYNKEQATGDDRYNILTVVMNQFNVSLPDAVDWAVRYHKELEISFLNGLKKVPSWGEDVDEQVAMYIEHIANWPRGSASWNFEGGRYFGSRGLEVQKTRCVPLLAKREVTHPNKEDIEVTNVDCL
ncbi:terpenoid synthase [Irpex rosettiformis]|uniref:Terpenoid synthase n=1 Tax=Irpex rosettiformis TaxID=378272 RepID=A0ACB8U5H3_9APHY|nr:terpenoid synthase [Irpex rosettiformis]